LIHDAEKLLTIDHAELDALLDDVIGRLEDGVENAFPLLDLFWARLAMHIRAEHLRLFPAVLERAKKTNPAGSQLPSNIPLVVDQLHSDHDFFMRELARAIKAMRLVFYFGNENETTAVVQQLLEGVRDRLLEHNRIEEDIIYPLVADALIGEVAAKELGKAVQREIEKLPQRFR